MKGVVFNLLEEAVTATYGEETWEGLLDAASLEGAYTSLGSYPDEQMVALVGAASAALGLPAAAVLRWFGRVAMPLLANRYGQFFIGHASARSFLLSVNDIIHPEVRKLYAGAACPHFGFATDPTGRLTVDYRSPRQLCYLAEGFAVGAADHFGEIIEVEHLACMTEGAPACRLAISWCN